MPLNEGSIGGMPNSEASPRSSKRRKLSSEAIQNATPSTFQKIKAAVWGQSSTKKPQKTYGSATRKHKTTIEQFRAVADLGSHGRTDGLLEDEAKDGTFADSAYHSMSAQEDASDEGPGSFVTPLKLNLQQRKIRRQTTRAEPANGGEGTGAYQTPAEGKRKTQRARTPSLEKDELALEQDELAADQGFDVRERLAISKPAKALKEAGSDEDETSETEAHDQAVASRSSGRQRRRPRKYSLEMSEAIPQEQTPTKSGSGKRGRPKKVPIQPITTATENDVSPELSNLFTTLPTLSSNDRQNHRDEVVKEFVPTKKTVLVHETLSTPKKKRGRPAKSASAVLSSQKKPDLLLRHASVTPGLIEEHDATSHAYELKNLLQNGDYKESIMLLKNRILEGLTGKRRLPLIGLDDEYQKVYQVIEQTVAAGEGNSMLVIGARGTAKTTLVETVVLNLASDHRDNFHVVRLNGFVHTDDKLALKEIWRQLGREMEVDEDFIGTRSNYADTLASLLALLSHPTELSSMDTNAEHTAKSVVFIMDEFDLFASHPRQTLLYNLFDIAQSRKAPIAVLGLTTKIDVVESLEKRVKSRFSHRYVHISLPKSFVVFRDICRATLLCEVSHERSSTPHSFKHRLQHDNAKYRALYASWTTFIANVFDEDPTMDRFLRKIYTQTKSVSTFLSSCILPMTTLSSSTIPTGIDFISNALLPPDSKLHLLPGLSELELSILIAAARLDIILNTDTCNFNMAYDEYSILASRVKVQNSASGAAAVGGGARFWGKEVAMGAWEKLAELDLIVPALGAGGGGGTGDIGRSGKMWKVDVGLEEIGGSALDISGVMAKWCREI